MISKEMRYAMIARAAKKVQRHKRIVNKLIEEGDRITRQEDPSKSGMHWGDTQAYVKDNFGEVYQATCNEEWN